MPQSRERKREYMRGKGVPSHLYTSAHAFYLNRYEKSPKTACNLSLT